MKFLRFAGALKADIKFQIKQGFYSVYILLTIVYLLIISRLPENLNAIAVPLIVFSDPSVVGFFFIGGIIMLEKEQKILQYLVVTPLRSEEYLLSKIMGLALLSEAAGIFITLVTYKDSVNWVVLVVGILLSSIFFTLYGFIAAAGCKTMNEYFITMIPYLLFALIPCFSLLGFKYDYLFNIFPSVAGLRLILGAFNEISIFEFLVYILFLCVVNILLFFKVNDIFHKKIVYRGE